MGNLKVNFFNEDIGFRLTERKKLKRWILHAIDNEGFKAGVINYIFCRDEYLHKLNQDYLNHDTYTDIISFDLSDIKGRTTGDIYISVERAKENARSFKQKIQWEIRRLMIHGALHLMGYKDKGKKEKINMIKKEDYYLSLLS